MTMAKEKPKEKTAFQWDVFLSHSSAQKPLVRAIVQQWRELGLSVFFDEDTIQPGEDVVTALDRARDNSRHTVLLITPESIASPWVDQELNAAVYLDPGARERRLIPVLLEPVADSEIPISVRKLNRVDLTDAMGEAAGVSPSPRIARRHRQAPARPAAS